tara:strand:- start:24133 stop:24540 length:408 start_codon:yes stop_codon:yes gene_type:complete
MDLISLINESRFESGMGSSAGRSSIHNGGKKQHTKAGKSKVKVYDSITDALKKGYMGQIFSTKEADRFYVITKAKWGKDDEQIINGRSAKGFTPGNIPSTFKDVKGYAVRTMVRHSGNRSKKYNSGAYWKSRDNK